MPPCEPAIRAPPEEQARPKGNQGNRTRVAVSYASHIAGAPLCVIATPALFLKTKQERHVLEEKIAKNCYK
jgi:hypothetical protein